MNNWTRKISSRLLLISAAVILGLYLILILGVTNLGQTKLKESQHRELNLKVQSYSRTLEQFFVRSSEHIEQLATDKSMLTFYANLANGMSMQYGLGASLSKLKRELNYLLSSQKINQEPIFSQISLIDYTGKVILESGSGYSFNLNMPQYHQIHNSDTLISTTKQPDGIHIKLVKPVRYSGKVVGYLIAQLNKNIIIKQMTTQEYEESHSRMYLTTSSGCLFIWDTLSTDGSDNRIDNSLYFETPINNTPFTLKSWFEPLSEKDIFTSNWFILGLSILAIPVIVGLFYIFFVNNINLVLRTKVEQSQRQQKTLSIKNKQLLIEVEKRKQSEQQLEYQATHDALTGLANRKFANDKLEKEIEHAIKEKSNVLILFIDLDNFKKINDTLGHLAGDMVLIKSAERIINMMKSSMTLSRFGGDEFLLIVPNTNDDEAKNIASTILSLFEQSFEFKQQEFFISTSIGIAMFPQDANNSQQLLANADTAMYIVKQEGRNAFNFYNESMNSDRQRALDLDSRLRQAMTNKEFELYYQPIIDLNTQKIIGAEALMRWNDDIYGFVPPDEFILIAEKNGLIHQLGEFALNKACFQVAQWQKYTPLQISVNFSSIQFRFCDRVLSQIESALHFSGLPAEKLDIEITESLLVEYSHDLIALLKELQSMGVKLTIDDFGTGYSSLSYLQKFPFNRLKIDRSFLFNMHNDENDKVLVDTIIAMAEALKLEIVAEGIEDIQHVDYLKNKCQFGQGYYFSKPLPSEEFELLLKKHYERNI